MQTHNTPSSSFQQFFSLHPGLAMLFSVQMQIRAPGKALGRNESLAQTIPVNRGGNHKVGVRMARSVQSESSGMEW